MRKSIPSIMCLLAAAVTALIVYFRDLGLKTMIIALLAVIVIFYFLGSVIEMILNKFDADNKPKVSDEGEVIEKEATSNDAASNADSLNQ